MRSALRVAVTTFVSALVLRASPALAHIDLLEPEARTHGTAANGDTDIDDNSSLKNGPCGQVTTGRSARVARYTPGETIRVRVREENAHESYLRVALDLDGNDFALRTMFPGGPETQAEAEAAEAALGTQGLLLVYREDNDAAGFVHELEVTLPEQSCDNCTLQVLQYMYDDPGAPYYFQCADLVIAEDGADGAIDAGAAPPDAGEDAPGAALPGNAGSGGSGGSGAGGGAGGSGGPSAAAGASTEPAGGAGGASGGAASQGGDGALGPVRATPDDEGGCSTSPQPRGTPLGMGLLGLTLIGLATRRRRGRPRAASRAARRRGVPERHRAEREWCHLEPGAAEGTKRIHGRHGIPFPWLSLRDYFLTLKFFWSSAPKARSRI